MRGNDHNYGIFNLFFILYNNKMQNNLFTYCHSEQKNYIYYLGHKDPDSRSISWFVDRCKQQTYQNASNIKYDHVWHQPPPEVSIAGSVCTTKVYCKTDHFPFEVNSFPFLESNIDNGLCYRVFYSQVIRFQRLCSNCSGFETRTVLGLFLGLFLGMYLGLFWKDMAMLSLGLKRNFVKH